MAFTARTETYVDLASFDITVTKPTNTANGDILFCWLGWYAAVTIDSVPNGWTLLAEYLDNTDRYALYYKIAASEGASWDWSFTATTKVRAVCSCYTGGDFNAADPIDVVSNTAYREVDSYAIAASMSVTSVNSPLVFFAARYRISEVTFTKPTIPTEDWVEDDDAGSTISDFWTEVCSMIWSGSGATGDMSATMSVGVSTKHAFAVALNPPAGAFELSRTDGVKLGDTRLLEPVVVPTAITQAASNIGGTTARINGKISDDGGASCEARFRWRKKGEQTFFPIDYVEVIPGTTGYWVDIDLSSYIPAGATMAIFHVRNTHTVNRFDYGLRCKGSTDNRYNGLYVNTHTWAMVKVDSNRIIQAIIGNSTYIDIFLVGYTISGVTGFTNGIDCSPASLGSWQDMDLSSYVPEGTLAAIFEVQTAELTERAYGLRKKGSTDARTQYCQVKNQFAFIVGVDSNRFCQGYRQTTSTYFYLVGYITAGVVMNTNAPDKSLGTTDSYQDIDIGDGCAFGFFEIVTTTAYSYALRRKGDAQDYYYHVSGHSMAVVACDADSIVEGKIENTDVDFFLVGYASPVWVYTSWQNTLVTNDTYYADLTELDPATEYEFQTQAKNSAGEGEWTTSAYFTTILVLSVVDSILVGDSSLRSMLAGLSRADGLKSGDTNNPYGMVNMADGLKAGDSLSLLASLLASDGIKIGDSSYATLLLLSLIVSDGLKLGDSNIISLILPLIITDGTKLGDSLSILARLVVSDGLELGDTTSMEMLADLLRSDGVELGDFPTTGEAILYLVIVEGIKAGDTRLIGMLADIQAADGTKIGDSSLAKMFASLLSADGLKVGEGASPFVNMLLAVTDGLEMGDSTSLENLIALAILEAIKVGDTGVLGGILGRILKLVIVTSQYRKVNVVTCQKRKVRPITTQKRKVRVITGA